MSRSCQGREMNAILKLLEELHIVFTSGAGHFVGVTLVSIDVLCCALPGY